MFLGRRPLAVHLHHFPVQVLPWPGSLPCPDELLLQIRPGTAGWNKTFRCKSVCLQRSLFSACKYIMVVVYFQGLSCIHTLSYYDVKQLTKARLVFISWMGFRNQNTSCHRQFFFSFAVIKARFQLLHHVEKEQAVHKNPLLNCTGESNKMQVLNSAGGWFWRIHTRQ